MKRLLPALAALLMTTLAIQFDEKDLATEEALWNLYERWRAEHNLPSDQWPTQQEKVRRFGAFKDNVRFIHAHNQRPDRPSYTLRLNKFGDMGRDDFRAIFGFRSDFKAAAPAVPGFIYQDVQDAPDSIDWREKGAVNPVKNQGKCGSCWAFSTVASVEGINQIKTGNLLSLSEQELVDCDTSDNDGCNGGLMANAFEFIKRNGGITTESAYPYTARRGTCDTFKAKQSPMVVIDGHQVVPENNEEAMMKAVANQPISVAIEASGQAFQFYSEGVFTGECGTELDHGVAVVGYGVTEEGRSYWIVRNSWGPEWGENGYIRMQRGVDASEGLCGIAMQPSYPLKTTSSNPTTKSRTRRGTLTSPHEAFRRLININ